MEHVLKVQPPYLDALLDGSKTFEVRRNDRAFQRGDILILWEPREHATGLCKNKHPDLSYAYDGSRSATPLWFTEAPTEALGEAGAGGAS